MNQPQHYSIYLIEDDQSKAERISEFVSERAPDAQLRLYRSYQSGLKAILAEAPALVLLDMTIPTFDGDNGGRPGRPRHLGGYDLMRKMRRNRINTGVFIISQLGAFGEGDDKVSFDEIVEKCGKEFPDVFKGATYFNQASDTWKVALSEVLGSVT